MRPLELIQAAAWFFARQSPGIKRHRDEPPPPLGHMRTQFSPCALVRVMCGCVATACRRLATLCTDPVLLQFYQERCDDIHHRVFTHHINFIPSRDSAQSYIKLSVCKGFAVAIKSYFVKCLPLGFVYLHRIITILPST
jgi:hypothetical protein